RPPLFPYTTLFRSPGARAAPCGPSAPGVPSTRLVRTSPEILSPVTASPAPAPGLSAGPPAAQASPGASEGVFLSPFYPVLPLAMLTFWSAFAAAVLYDQGWKVGYGLLAIAL